jgi:hypothetical protein
MLKLRSDERAGRFGGMIAADARLCVSLQFVQGDSDSMTVCVPHPVIATD